MDPQFTRITSQELADYEKVLGAAPFQNEAMEEVAFDMIPQNGPADYYQGFLSAFVVFGQLLGSCHQNKMPPEEVMERVFPFLLDFQLALVRHLKPLVEQREHP